MSPRSDVWERQPQTFLRRLNEGAASASHVDVYERLGVRLPATTSFSEFASIPPSAKNKLQLFATQANFTTKEIVMPGNLFGEKKKRSETFLILHQIAPTKTLIIYSHKENT